MKSSVRILLVGGGSGGHFYPLMSVAQKLNTHPSHPKLYYMGPEPYDQNLLSVVNAEYIFCPAGKRRKYSSFLNFIDLFKTVWGIFVAIITLYKIYPDVVVSKGSYTSVPVVIAAVFLNIPIIVHESDTRLGAANKLAARFARHVAISFEDVLPFLSNKETAICTGVPIREALLLPPTENTRGALGIDNNLPIILILGGSSGAERINQLILDTLDELLPFYNIIHQTGKNNFDVTVLSAQELIQDDTLLSRYRPVPFFSDPSVLNDAYHSSTIIISRAGTGTIYEIATHGKPAILIPIPESISHDQRTNAYAYARSGAATVLEESNIQDSLLSAEIDRIIKNEAVYNSMAKSALHFAPKDAAHILAEMSLTLAETH